MELIDITVPLGAGMVVWEGDPGVHTELVDSMERGDAYNLTRLDLSVHSGTHVDAPRHFLAGGATVEQIAPDALLGPVTVVDATAVEGTLDAQALAGLDLPADRERLIFKTTNSRLYDLDEFVSDHVSFDESGAGALVEGGTRAVGIDYLSIGDDEAHRVLLGAGVVPIETLDLRGVEPGAYELICLPLAILGSDGAPARALLRRP